MTYRLIFELVVFLTPFAAFGLYRLARQEALEEGKKPWPITILFIVGAFLAIAAWVVLIIIDRGGGETCYEPRRLVNGEMVGGDEVPCPKEKSDLGRPASEDPGSRAEGLGHTDNAGPDTPAGPLEERLADDAPASDTLPDDPELPG
ncbi:MAG: DUF6111 family protein [Henriciella sp.]